MFEHQFQTFTPLSFSHVKTDIFDDFTLFFKIALENYTISTDGIKENTIGILGKLDELYADNETNLEKDVEASLGFDCVLKRNVFVGLTFD